MFIVVGVFGNIVTIIIFRQKEFQNQPTSVYFIILSISNISNLFYAPFTFIPSLWTVNSISCKVFFGSLIIISETQSWILVTCSIDRLLMVTVPQKFLFRKKLIFQLTIIIIIVLILTFTIVPYLIYYELDKNQENETMSLLIADSPSWVSIYGKIEFGLLRTIFPFLIMIISSVLLFWRVLIQKKKLKGNNACFQKEYQMVISLVIVDLLFLVVHLPNTIYAVIYKHDDGSIIYSFFISVFSIIGYFYTAFEFLIFIFSNKIYRDLFARCISTLICRYRFSKQNKQSV